MNETEIEQRITFEALVPHFEKMREWAFFTTLVPITVVVVMWSQVDQWMLLGWLLLVLAGIGARFVLTTAYHRQAVHYQNARKWHVRLLMMSVYLGGLWAIAVFAFYVPDSPPHQIFIITLSVTLGVGSITSGTYWLPLYFVYGVPILTALLIRFALMGTLPFAALVLMMMFALLASFSFAKKLNMLVRSEMRLRLESADMTHKLEVKSEELQDAVYAKSRILATASHDLRQPLHALSLFIDALKQSDSPAESARIFRRIDLSMESMRKLFDALFDMSRLDANVVQPELSHFDIAQCLAELRDEFAAKAEKKQLRLIVHARSDAVWSDQALLERILRNLIENALRYTRSGGVLLTARRRKATILIQVWDTGIGIPQESQNKAFAEFQQLERPSDEQDQGLGFGLAIVRRLCNLLDYPLELHSKVGKGSIFSVEVPVGEIASSQVQHDGSNKPSWHASGQCIVVIDDDMNVLNAMETLLASWQFDVIAAPSLTEIQDQLRTSDRRPDLILSDLSLNGADNGIEAINSLRNQYGDPGIPGILITGSTGTEQLKLAEESGLKLVQKPVRPASLRSIIQHHLSATTPLSDVTV
ncbi:ATP-binding response regulator [Marinobacter caseinilyticus]|uniref:ATP-binding response regulator n=1 Tax=Marinobacter caseinilyticus TaxID=2692195 RepID=UPI0014089D47|nr:hybrid sensor histidine kinase/response regulator [Marinobacter caseinilyticus]